MREHRLKFLFLGVMMALVFFGRADKDRQKKPGLQENIGDTSLAVTVKPLPQFPAANQDFSRSLALVGDSLNIQPQDEIASLKNFDVAEPELKVKAALVEDLDFKTEFFRFNIYDRWALASLAKLMAAIVAYEEVGEQKTTVMSQSAIEAEGVSGDFKAGEEYTIGDLIRAALAVSSNDAATAIAEFYGLDKFTEKMNEKAKSLGMEQTNFVEASGISFANQSSADDLKKLVSYIYKNTPRIFEITRQQKVKILELKSGAFRELQNINNFVVRPDFFGGKTGFTDQAGGNLITIFNYNGRKILVIVLGTDDRYGQTELLYNWVKKAFNFNSSPQ